MYFCCVWFVCLSLDKKIKKKKLEEIFLTKHYFVVFLPEHKKKNKEKKRHGRTTTTTTTTTTMTMTMTMSMSMQRISFLSFGRRSAAIGNTRKKIEKIEKRRRRRMLEKRDAQQRKEMKKEAMPTKASSL